METLVLIGLVAAIVLLLVGLTLILRGLELAFPAFSRFLEALMGPDEDGKPF